MDEDDFSAAGYLKAKKQETARLAAQQRTLDKDLIALEKQHSFLEQDALRSTKNALETIKTTEQVALKTNEELVIQGEILDDANRKMLDVDRNADENYKSAKKVKKHGHLFAFLYGRRAEQKSIIDREFQEKQQEIESKKLMHKVNQDQLDKHGTDALPEGSSRDAASAKAMQDRTYRNETDRQIDENLDGINGAVDNIKILTAQMNEEMDRQQLTIDAIDATREHTGRTLDRATGKIQRYAS